MRYVTLLLAFFMLAAPARAQFVVEESRPQPGADGVSLSREVAFAFSEEISVSTNWSTAFLYEPRDALSYDQVSLCLNLEGDCGGDGDGDGELDDPRFVRFEVEHEPDTDYTWMVYTVETPDGTPMDTPYVLRYTTAADIGQQEVAGAVTAPTTKSATWTTATRTSLRTLARGLERSGLGRPFYERDDADAAPSSSERLEVETQPTEPGTEPGALTQAHFGTLGAKAHSGGHTQILLLDDFSTAESAWTVRAADVIEGSSGDYHIEHVRDDTYWPIAVRYTDGSNTEIEAIGFHDADADGTPDPVTVDGTDHTDVNVQLYEFFPTTVRNPYYLAAAQEAAAAHASDQELKLVHAESGADLEGTAYAWRYRYYSPSEDLETSVVVGPLDVEVNTSSDASFMASLASLPEPFLDSDVALARAMEDGGESFIEEGEYRDHNLTIILQGGELHWTTSDPPSETFWRVRIIAVTSTGAEDFEYFTDMALADLPRPNNLTAVLEDEGVQLAWDEETGSEVAGFHLYRTALPAPAKRIATLSAGEQSYLDESIGSNQNYRYWVASFNDDGGQSRFSEPANVSTSYPTTVDYDISRAFGDASEQQSYRLVALPGAGDVDVASTLDGEADEDWTVYWDDGAAEDFLQSYDGSSTFTFRPGRGFWMLSKDAWTPSGTADAVSPDPDGTYAIDLHDGWNIIANPFGVDVTWSAVKEANDDVTQALWQWNGSFEEASTFVPATEGKAFYFLNDAGLDALQIPYPAAAEAAAAPAAALRAPEHTLTLTAFQEDERMAAVRAGMAANAADGRDAYDQFAPPGYFEGTTLHLVNEAVDATYTDLAAEYRATQREGHAFDLTLHTTASGDAVELRVSGLEQFAGQEVVLVDPTVGRAYDLRTEAPVRLRPEAEAMDLTLLVGSAAFVEAEQAGILPTTLQLLPNYPNPFREQTTIEFALPERDPVRLVVYDVLGRRVRTLADRSFEPGLHAIRWDGRNEAGQPAASGLYLSRLEVGDRHRVQRIVLVR